MRMFLYYFSHTLRNQLLRFIRTWAFFLLIVFLLIGGFAVYAAGWYYRKLSAAGSILPKDLMEFFDASGMTFLNALELGAGILILGILVIQIIGAEKSVSRLFLQADVNILFASDLSAQTVLVFRLMTTLGLAFAAGVVMFAQVPLLMRRFGFSFFGAVSIPAAFCLTLVYSVLIKALVYEVGSVRPFFRHNLRWFVLALAGILGILFYLVYRYRGDEVLMRSAQMFFNSPPTRFIPVWGWIKGYMLFALEGKTLPAMALLGLSLALLPVLAVLVKRIPADYYEETQSRAQEIAMLREGLSREGAAALVTALARRGRGEEKGSFHFGQGSSVYFYKALYNRFRFARWGFLTRTGVTYLLVGLGAGLFVRLFMDEPLAYIPALVLAAMIFFRTIVSPVAEDIRKALFRMQPGSIWSRLFFSGLGGSAGCVVDVLPALLLSAVVSGFPWWRGLVYLPFLAAADFFAAAAGAFSDVSLPETIGTAFKQVIQILLLYVGIIFDGMILVTGIARAQVPAAFVTVTLLNLLLGSFFLGLTGVWLSPSAGRPRREALSDAEKREGRRAYARVGFALSGMFAAVFTGQLLLPKLWPGAPLLQAYLPVYGIGFPVFLLLVGRRPGSRRIPAGKPLGAGVLALCIPACLFAAYSGNAAGLILGGLLRLIRPVALQLPRTAGISAEMSLVQMALLTYLSPLMEEFIFRRSVIDRVRPYGEHTALLVSALLFGLFHEDINRVCYAFMLGLVFGWIYMRTGRLRYTVLLHILVNSLTVILLPALLARVNAHTLSGSMNQLLSLRLLRSTGTLPLFVYLIALFVLALFGGVVFLSALRGQREPKGGIRMAEALSASGMAVFLVLTGVFMYASL